MNGPFILIVCFGLLVLGVIIAGVIFNAKVGGAVQLAPWMRRLRRFQNKEENVGWRIQMIPYDDSSKPMVIDSRGILTVVSIVGALGFICGLAIGTYGNREHVALGLIVAGSSWVVALCSYWFKARMVRLDWDVARARCVDRELRKVWIAGPHGGNWGWIWRIVCQYEYLGIPYHVTPMVYWANFISEEAAIKYLDERISPNGECTLRVDLKNPLRTELMDQGIKDKLLY